MLYVVTVTPNNKDIVAQETLSYLKNYNRYVHNLVSKNITKKNILDFGSGYGLFCEYLIKKGYNVNAFEINEVAKQKTIEKKIKTFSKFEDITQKYNTVVSMNVLEHIEDDVLILENIKTIMDKEGKLILYLPCSKFVWSSLDEDANHYRRYSKKEIIQKLTKARYEIQSIHYVDFIGWLSLVVLKCFRYTPTFNKDLLVLYDKFIFRFLIHLDKIFKNVIGKNLYIEAKLKT